MMQTWADLRMVIPDANDAISINFMHEPIPAGNADITLQMSRVPIVYCPHCGRKVGRYDLSVPLEAITRGETTGGSCNDFSCRFCTGELTRKCSFSFRNVGCYITSEEALALVMQMEASAEENLIRSLVKTV